MVNVLVRFNTNHDNRDDLRIEEGAVEEFTKDAYRENSFSAVVQFECRPQEINPEIMEILVELGDIGSDVINWIKICTHLIKLVKKAHGYVKHLLISGAQGKETIIEITDETSPEELASEIKKTID